MEKKPKHYELNWTPGRKNGGMMLFNKKLMLLQTGIVRKERGETFSFGTKRSAAMH